MLSNFRYQWESNIKCGFIAEFLIVVLLGVRVHSNYTILITLLHPTLVRCIATCFFLAWLSLQFKVRHTHQHALTQMFDWNLFFLGSFSRWDCSPHFSNNKNNKKKPIETKEPAWLCDHNRNEINIHLTNCANDTLYIYIRDLWGNYIIVYRCMLLPIKTMTVWQKISATKQNNNKLIQKLYFILLWCIEHKVTHRTVTSK